MGNGTLVAPLLKEHRSRSPRPDAVETSGIIHPIGIAEIGVASVRVLVLPGDQMGSVKVVLAGAAQFYRARATFEKTTKWLREHGVKTDKSLHKPRNEFGSIICESADIHTASRQLRHSDLATTASFYTYRRLRATVAIGAFLAADQLTQEGYSRVSLLSTERRWPSRGHDPIENHPSAI